MIDKVKNTGNFLWKHRNKIMFITMIVLAILFLRQCGELKYERKKAAQNQAALTDTLTTLRQSNGDLITQKATFVASRKELEKLNKDLYDEVELLREQKSKAKVVIKTKIVYRDTGSVHNDVVFVGRKLDKYKYNLNFDYVDSDNIMRLKGKSEFSVLPKLTTDGSDRIHLDVSPGRTIFDTIQVKFGLTLGVKEDRDGIDRVFAKADSTDKIIITDINSVQLEDFYKSKYNKNKKKFSVGPYVGLGLGIGNNGQFVVRPQVGLGVQFSLFKL